MLSVYCPEEIQLFADLRIKARQEKNWTESDRLRDEISKHGYIIEDTSQGQKLIKK